MYEEIFTKRLEMLRSKKGVSAREMSLALGQNPGYINNIETGKALPSMVSFFAICEYLGTTPKDYFDMDASQPAKLRTIEENLKKMPSDKFDHIAAVINDLAN